MSGPPPTPLHLRILRGNPSKRRLRPEPEPQVATDCPEPPSFLEPYARDEWWRIGPELHRLGLLTVVDLHPFAAYCTAYSIWRTSEEILARIAANDPAMSGLLVKSVDGNVRINPLVVMSRKAAEDMLRFAGEFGMTPVARSRLAAGVGTESFGKFDGLIGGA